MKERKANDSVYLIPEPPERRSKSSLFWLSLVIAFALCCFFTFMLWFNVKSSLILIRFIEDEKDCKSPDCDSLPDRLKFDCHPEEGASPSRCQQRGCCYKARSGLISPDKGLPPLDVPYCYFPSNYEGYALEDSLSLDGRHITAKLRRRTPSGFPGDIPNLNLVVTFIDDSKLQIKITDADSDRFEVPIPINAELGKLKNPLYEVQLNDRIGELTIKRRSSGTVIFQTNLTRLVYSDQLLQLSTFLPSPVLYGIGEKYGSFMRNVNWTRITLLNSDRSPVPNYPLYGSHPFYLSLEKDGNANGVFLLNSNPMDVILQPTPALTFRPIGGVLDLFVLLGPSPASVVQQYTSVVGRTFMPPYWSLGFHLCRYGYNSLNKTRETMERNLAAGIPIDVQWNDIDYMDRYKDFTYDKDKFAGLPEFVDDLHQRGMHYVIMTDPGISCSEKPGTYAPYDEALKDDVLIKNANGTVFVGKVWTDGETVWPDFSHPNAASYWSRQFSNFYKEVKYDGVWIDMNEPSNFYDGGKDGCPKSTYEDPVYVPGGGSEPLRRKTVCMTAKHYKTIHYNEHNLLAYREATATNQALRSVRGRRPFIISRASYSGQGVQSGHWSGDIFSTYEDMRYTIPSMLNFNLYGMSMIGSDICGFNGNVTVQLCARWQALGAFYPFSRNHNERVTAEQDPVALGPQVVEATKKSLGMRYLMLPYLYTLFYRSHAYGDTVIRPLVFEFPQDSNTHSVDEQFLWGPGMMIVPALYPDVTEVSAYLPRGVWYDGTGRPTQSTGQRVTVTLGVTDIGLMLRGGYILPAQVNAMTTTQSRQNPFVLVGGLDENKEASGELYWDDGDSLETYEQGKYTLIKFSANQNSLNCSVERKEYTDNMSLGEINLAGLDRAPTQVTINGVKCLKQTTPAKGGMNFFRERKADEFTANDAYCVFDFHPPSGLAIGIKNVSLLSPISIVWN